MSNASAQAASPPWDDASITAIRRDMLRFARMQLRDSGAAEDMVQEALMAAMTSAKGFAGRSAFKTWMFAILRNRIVAHICASSRELNGADLAGRVSDDDGLADFDVLFSRRGLCSGCGSVWRIAGSRERPDEANACAQCALEGLCANALPGIRSNGWN